MMRLARKCFAPAMANCPTGPQKIKKSAKKRGKSTKRAKEIAARTVNKRRSEEGRTPNKKTQGTGNPNRELEERTRDELMNHARELDIRGRSSMNKKELIQAIRKHQ